MKELSRIDLDLIEVIMGIEEGLEIEIPDDDVVAFDSPRHIIDWLTSRLAGQPMGGKAALFVENLARRLQLPDLVPGINGTWRLEQIKAVVCEVLRVHGLDDWSDPPDPDASVGAPLKPRPHPRSGVARAFPDEQP